MNPQNLFAENRIAFVVGNSTYTKLPPLRQLKSPVNDATAITEKLKKFGYKVVEGENLTRENFITKWDSFLEEIAKKDSLDSLVIYLSGHGVEIEGNNYFLPTDIPGDITPGRRTALTFRSISIGQLLENLKVSRRPPKATVIILDACREDPMVPQEFKSIGKGGLARILEPPEGTFIMYSAAPGEISLDKLSNQDTHPNSVYTRILLELMDNPNLTLPELAGELRHRVRDLAKTVNVKQRPAYLDELIGKFCFPGCKEQELVFASFPKNSKKAWEWLKNTDSSEAMHFFINAYPKSSFLKAALKRLDLLQGSKGSLFIIAIGISQYENPAYRLRKYSVDDARSIVNTLKQTMGPAYTSVEEHLLVDDVATRENILTAFHEVYSKASAKDTLIVFLSGLTMDTATGKSYFLSSKTNPQNFNFTAIDFQEIQKGIARMPGRRVAFLDVVQSNLNDFSDLEAEQVNILVSSRQGQIAFELPQLQSSAFTKAIIEGLTGEAANKDSKTISFRDLAQYVDHRLPELTDNRQRPAYVVGSKDIALVPLDNIVDTTAPSKPFNLKITPNIRR